MAIALVACSTVTQNRGASLDKEFNRIKVDLDGTLITVDLTHDPTRDYGWSAGGKQSYLKALTLDVVDGELQIRCRKTGWPQLFNWDFGLKRDNLRLTLNLPREAYDQVEVNLDGTSNITIGVTVGTASLDIDGASTVKLAQLDRLALELDGASSVNVTSCNSASLQVNGAGDVVIDQLQGGLLDCDVDGAASLDFTGEVAAAIFDVDGAASVAAEHLTCGDLDIKMDGICSATIGRVTGDVTQQVSALSSLEILERD